MSKPYFVVKHVSEIDPKNHGGGECVRMYRGELRRRLKRCYRISGPYKSIMQAMISGSSRKWEKP